MVSSSRRVFVPVLVWFVAACSSTSRPPELGDCKPVGDAGCTVPTGGVGGAGSGEDAGGGQPSSCNVNLMGSMCDQCAANDCCSPIAACTASADCSNLFSCIEGCSGSTSCADSCDNQYASSVALYDEIGSCVAAKCPVCEESGVGDPCSGAYFPCLPYLTCNGMWCTEPCTGATSCTGIGVSGGNTAGFANVCVSVPGSGDTCTPECASDSDCTVFPGTYCKSTTAIDGSTVQVCTVLPDGG